MVDEKSAGKIGLTTSTEKQAAKAQKIIVFQQNESGQKKVEGVRQYGNDRFVIEIISIDVSLPPVIDDAGEYIPQDIQADLVLDFLKHPDLSLDLAEVCRDKNIPVIASGKKLRGKGVLTPPT
jgi:hypothetical protein